MIGLVLLAQKDLAAGLLAAAEHTFGRRPPRLELVPVDYQEAPEALATRLAERLAALDEGQGVLILADVYGATHTNVATRLLERGRYELVTGVNLPMLLKVLNYRDLPMDELIDKALSGGCGGIVCAAKLPGRLSEAGR
jgi:PTS system ascorbate-specific IIA component